MHLAEVAAGNEACLEEPQGEVEVAQNEAALQGVVGVVQTSVAVAEQIEVDAQENAGEPVEMVVGHPSVHENLEEDLPSWVAPPQDPEGGSWA